MAMISLMKPYIDSSVAVISTARGYAFARWFGDYYFSLFGSKDLCGELKSSVSQYLSLSRSFPRSIAASLVVVYSTCAVAMTKGNIRQIKTSLYTIDMQVDAVVVFAWIRR